MVWEVRVTVYREGAPHLTASFDRSPITLGAQPTNDLVLNDPFVSGEHAVVMVSRGELVYRDQSTNGSFFEGRRIEEQNLGTGGRIAIPPFEVELSFEVAEEDGWKTAFRADLAELRAGAQASRPTLEMPPVPPPAAAVSPPFAVPSAAAPPLPPRERRPTQPPGSFEVTPRGLEEARTRELPSATAAHDRFHLRVLNGPPELVDRIYALPPRPARVGRAEAADVHLPVTTVSRSHAILEPQGADAYLLVDDHSANGCFVGDRQVSQARLEDGDEFRLGDVRLQLCLGARAARPPGRRQAATSATPLPGREPGELRLAARPVEGDPAAVVIEVGGRVDSYNYTRLADALNGAIEDGGRHLVVDLSRVDAITHTGLGVLAKSLARLQTLRGELWLVGLSRELRDTFARGHLDGLFRERLAGSLDEALAARRRR